MPQKKIILLYLFCYSRFFIQIFLTSIFGTTLYKKVKGRKEIPESRRREIRKFILKYHEGIVEKWTEFFVKDKQPKIEKITKKI